MTEEKRCPMCGKLNPAGEEVCRFCSARLKPLSIPEEPSESENAIPGWLLELGVENEMPTEPAPADVGLDWLSEIGMETEPSAGEEKSPVEENFQDLVSEASAEESTPALSPVEKPLLSREAEEETLSLDWLSQEPEQPETLPLDLSGQEEETSPTISFPETPEAAESIFLEDTGAQEVPSVPEEPSLVDADTLAWMQSLESIQVEPLIEQLPADQLAAVDETASPPWYEELNAPAKATESAAAAPSGVVEGEIPEWLQTYTPPGEAEQSTESMDWVSELAEESETSAGLPWKEDMEKASALEPTGEEAPTEIQGTEPQADLTWKEELAAGVESELSSLLIEPGESAVEGKEEGLPAWMKDSEGEGVPFEEIAAGIETEPAAAESAAAEPAVSEESPEDLGWLDLLSEKSQPTSTPESEEEGLPVWMKDSEGEGVPFEEIATGIETEPAAAESEAAEPAVSEESPEDLGWLDLLSEKSQPTTTPESEEEGGMPAWMKGSEGAGIDLDEITAGIEASLAAPTPETGQSDLFWSEETATESGKEEEPPDWLKQFTSAGEEAAPQEVTPSEAVPFGAISFGVPPQGAAALEETAPEKAAPEKAAPEAEEASLDWLSSGATLPIIEEEPEAEFPVKGGEVFPEETAPESAFLEGAPAQPSEIPDWLKQDTTPVSFEAEAGEIPDWLASEAEAVPEPPVEKPREVPDWLAFGTVEAGALTLPVEEEEVPAEELTPIEEPEALELPQEPAVEEAESIFQERAEEQAIPEWLKESQETASVPYEQREEEIEGIILGSDMGGEEEAETDLYPSIEEQPAKKKIPGSLEEARLPEWLEPMRPVSTLGQEGAAKGALETSGPLAGLRGTLPGAADLTFPYQISPMYTNRVNLTDGQRSQALILEQILSEEVHPQVEVRSQRRVSTWVLRFLVSLVVIVTVCIPLFSGSQDTALPDLFPASLVGMFQAHESLTDQSAVLVIADYTPGFSSELNTVAAPIIEHLMLKNARIALISTDPTGPALGQNLLQTTLTEQGISYVLSERTINLGYLPGGSTAIRQFALDPKNTATYAFGQDMENQLDPWSSPAVSGIANLSDFDEVILITPQLDSARDWIEQASSSLGDTPLYVISSAQISPLLQPYLESGAISGVASGLTDSAMYVQLTNKEGDVRNYWDSYQYSTLLIIFFILLGTVIQLAIVPLTKIKRSRRARA